MWAEICEAWAGELTSTVAGLDNVPVHLFAPWSVEAVAGAVGERHLAIWPQGDGSEAAEGLTTAPADMLLARFIVMCWEDATAETSRLADDENANRAWLELHEAIRNQFYERDNARLGLPAEIMRTRYTGTSFDRSSGQRVMALSFEVLIPKTYV